MEDSKKRAAREAGRSKFSRCCGAALGRGGSRLVLAQVQGGSSASLSLFHAQDVALSLALFVIAVVRFVEVAVLVQHQRNSRL